MSGKEVKVAKKGDAAKAEEKVDADQRKELLLFLGKFIDGKLDGSPLITAATRGNVSFVKTLVNKLGADKNFKDEVGDTALVHAAFNGYLPVVQTLLEAGVDLTGISAGTAVNAAAGKGHGDILDALLKAGVDKDARDEKGSTPLLEAAYFGLLPMVKTLVAARADVNIADKDGSTALLLASQKGHAEVVDVLLDAGAEKDVREGTDGDTPLIVAATHGHLPVVKNLLAARADIKQTDNYGNTALHGAANTGHDGIVRVLLRAEAEVNTMTKRGMTALSAAAGKGHAPVVETLLAAGADTSLSGKPERGVSDCLEDTPLIMAAGYGRLLVVHILLANGADVNARTPAKGYTALLAAAKMEEWAVVEPLVKAGADVNIIAKNGASALIYATGAGHVPTMEVLLKAGADVNVLPKKTKGVECEVTPLILAACEGNIPAMDTLLAAGADVNARTSNGMSALTSAGFDEQWTAVETLLKAGADPNSRGNKHNPNSVLEMAARKGQLGIMEAIIKLGVVDVNEVNAIGTTALSCAAGNDQADAVDLLIKSGCDMERMRYAFGCANKQAHCKAMLVLLQKGVKEDGGESWLTALHRVCAKSPKNTEAAVDLLLRWGADETALNKNGKTPAELLTSDGEDDESLSQDGVERVRLLLARAPADRAWRRRGWLVMVRARNAKDSAKEAASAEKKDGEDKDKEKEKGNPPAKKRQTITKTNTEGRDIVVVIADPGKICDLLFHRVVSFL